jgi:hypothetical protein
LCHFLWFFFMFFFILFDFIWVFYSLLSSCEFQALHIHIIIHWLCYLGGAPEFLPCLHVWPAPLLFMHKTESFDTQFLKRYQWHHLHQRHFEILFSLVVLCSPLSGSNRSTLILSFFSSFFHKRGNAIHLFVCFLYFCGHLSLF